MIIQQRVANKMSNISFMNNKSICSVLMIFFGLFAEGVYQNISCATDKTVLDDPVLKLEVISRFSLKASDFSKAGMGSGVEFGVDASGNIYFVAYRSDEYYVYKVSETGKLIRSFGRMGQGPGELELPISPTLLDNEKIAITDRNKKLVIYNTSSGLMVKEITFDMGFTNAIPLRNGGYLIQRSSYDQIRPDFIRRELVLLGDNKREVKILDSINELREDVLQNRRLVPYFVWEATAERIYSMSEDRGYEVLVYDHKGNLLNKIVGKPRRVKATEEIKRSVLGPAYKKSGPDNYFPNPLPPINHFFVDDEDRVFVMTYEKDPKSGFYLYEIFDREGHCLGSQGIQTIWAGIYFANMGIVAKKNRLYCWREDQDGEWEFVIQRINWLKE